MASYRRTYGHVYRDFDQAVARVLADPADCSMHVATQTSWCRIAPRAAIRICSRGAHYPGPSEMAVQALQATLSGSGALERAEVEQGS